MEVLRSYVVRLYREGPAGVTGMVESVEKGEVVPFRCVRAGSDLCMFLS
jgi:hypothetical protein